jgi:DNA replication licensing factor MCM2
MQPDEPFNLETYQVPLREWVTAPQTQAEVKRRFAAFLETYVNPASGERVHEKAVDAMASQNGSALPVSFLQLSMSSPILAIWLADVPKVMLSLFDEVATAYVLSRYPDYGSISDEIRVRISHLPVSDSLRDLRQIHLNAFVKVTGVVTRRTGVFPQLKLTRFNCVKCGYLMGPHYNNDSSTASNECPFRACLRCQSTGPFTLNSDYTVYRNYQKVTLQESPGSVPPGRTPRSKEVILVGDLIDSARPGEEVEVTGVYTHSFDPILNARQGFPVFATVIEANNVSKRSDLAAAANITDTDRRRIEELSKDPKIIQRITRSIAPSIYGHEHVKLAIALAMFGANEKNINGKHRIRGDINVLLLGDPGVAKSQFLKYVEKTAPRAVYTTGKGASAVGLTAAVHRDPLTGEWLLEGGALVLADRGICLIDEFDKMNDQDRTSIHEAMEQQSISISKASIVTTLQARCSVLAAANPIGGRYDIAKTFSDNVQLTDPILTRFDVLCVLKDEVDNSLDERLATFVVDSHIRAHPASRAAAAASAAALAASERQQRDTKDSLYDNSFGNSHGDLPPIPQELLKKYILEAKTLKPQLTGIDMDKIAKLYAELRKEAEVSGGVPIAVRHIESIMRMCEAVARMRMSAFVSESDVNLAIRVMLESFVQAQKFNVMRSLRRQFARYMIPAADFNQVLLVKLRELIREQQALEYMRSGGGADQDYQDDSLIEVRVSDLVDRARRLQVEENTINGFLRSEAFRSAGFALARNGRYIVRAGQQ